MEDAGGLALRPRERIISTARDLFRKHGIRGIGVDAIAEAANTNKMTLYRHFGSKDDLVVACLRDVASEVDAIWNGFEQDFPGDPLAQLMPGFAAVPNALSTMAAVATWPMWPSNWLKAIIRRDTSLRSSRRSSATAWQSFVIELGLRKQSCSPIPCRSCSKAPASVARVPASKGRAHDTSQLATL